jgi:hypothetical protein
MRKKILRFCGVVTQDYSGIGSKHYKASIEAAFCAPPDRSSFMLYDEFVTAGGSHAERTRAESPHPAAVALPSDPG